MFKPDLLPVLPRRAAVSRLHAVGYHPCEDPARRRLDMRLLLNWLLSAVALLIVSFFVPGFHVEGFKAALIAAIVIGLINATLGLLLKLVTLPLTVLTLGVFWWVVNALMLMLASKLLAPQFMVSGFLAAFIAAVVLSLVNMVLRKVAREVTD
jgi:putative membrane protein